MFRLKIQTRTLHVPCIHLIAEQPCQDPNDFRLCRYYSTSYVSTSLCKRIQSFQFISRYSTNAPPVVLKTALCRTQSEVYIKQLKKNCFVVQEYQPLKMRNLNAWCATFGWKDFLLRLILKMDIKSHRRVHRSSDDPRNHRFSAINNAKSVRRPR